MPNYDIPLSSVYEEGNGRRIVIEQDSFGASVQIVDRTGGTPYDLVPLEDTEVEEVIHILTAYLARDNDKTLGSSRTGVQYEEFRSD